MRKMQFEIRDGDRYMVDIWWLQWSFFCDGHEEIKDSIKEANLTLKTLNDYIKCFIEIWGTIDNPYYLAFIWFWDLNLCLTDDNQHDIQLSMPGADYFAEVCLKDLRSLRDMLLEFVNKYSNE